MPYEVTFTKRVDTPDRTHYINDCCVGGDVVLQALLPTLRQRYGEIQAEQEDWGWFVWFSTGGKKLAVDVFCDNPETGEFRMHLTCRVPRMLFSDKIDDTPELEDLRSLILHALTNWLQHPPTITPLDTKYRLTA